VDQILAAACSRLPEDVCSNPTSIDTLAVHAGTDKSSLYHGFTVFYEDQLKLLELNPLRILEVGVFRGASLSVWASKFPCAEVHGLDAFLDQHGGVVRPGRFKVAYADQENPASLRAATMGLKFDIIVDDGGHTMLQQQNTLAALWDRLQPGGLFIVEDLHTSLNHEANNSVIPRTLDLILGTVLQSPLVDMLHIRNEASRIEIFRPALSSNSHVEHITAVIQKKNILEIS